MVRQPWTIRRDAPLSKAKDLMLAHRIRHLPVLEGGKLVGILTERDVYNMERFKRFTDELKVEDAMTDEVYTATPEQPLDEVVEEMATRKYGAVIVMNRSHVEGIFTMVDGMDVLADVLRRATA